MLRLAALGTAAVLALGVSACGSGGSESSAGSGGSGGGTASNDLRVWFMQDSVPADAATWLQDEFAKQHPGSKLTVEVQQWNGIVQKLQTSLASKEQSPDIVEAGNTQIATFASVGALQDITDLQQALGGQNLIQSFKDAGMWQGKLYAAPFYAGSRVIYYRKDLFDKAGIPVPQTLDEFTAAVEKLQAANPDGTPNFSGMYLAGSDPHTNEGFLFTHGGNYAVRQGGTWVGALSSPESLAALRQVQELYQKGTKYALDSNQNAQVAYQQFNKGNVGVLSALSVAANKIDKSMWDAGKVGVMPLPGLTPGSIGTTFAGGSNIGISANTHNSTLARDAMKLIFSAPFQTKLASEAGWVPGNTTYASALSGPTADAARKAAEHSELTPNTPQWGLVDGTNVDRTFWGRIAKGEDPATVAKDTDAQLEKLLNQK